MIVTELPGTNQRVSSARRILSERELNSEPAPTPAAKKNHPVLIRKAFGATDASANSCHTDSDAHVDKTDPLVPLSNAESLSCPQLKIGKRLPTTKESTAAEELPCYTNACACESCTCEADDIDTNTPTSSSMAPGLILDSDYEPELRYELDSDAEPLTDEDEFDALLKELCDDSETELELCNESDDAFASGSESDCNSVFDEEFESDQYLETTKQYKAARLPSPPPSAYLGVAALAPRRSVAGSARQRIDEVGGGDFVFHEFMMNLANKLERALRASLSTTRSSDDSRFLFRDFAGHLAIALERFGPGRPGASRAPPLENWLVPFILPWLQFTPETLEAPGRIDTLEEVCSWMGSLANVLGGDELLQSTIWDSIADLMYLSREDVGEITLRAASVILQAATLNNDMLCRVVLLRHVTLNFDCEQRAPFRRRRLQLMALVLRRVEAADNGHSDILVEASRELERAAATEHDAIALRMIDELNARVRSLRTEFGIEPCTLPSPRTLPRFSMSSMRTFRSEAPVPDNTSARKSRRWRRFLSLRRWLHRKPTNEDEVVRANEDTKSMVSALSTATRRYALLQSGVSPKSPMTV